MRRSVCAEAERPQTRSGQGDDDARESAPSSASSRRGSFSSLPGASLIPTCGTDLVQVCQLAKVLFVPAPEMQQPYSLFKEFATVPEGGKLLDDGRLTQAQFARILRNKEQFFAGSEVASDPDILKAFRVADVNKDDLLSFQEFAMWMLTQTFAECLNIDSKERELRNLAKEYNLSLIQVDKYKRMFEELDEDGSGMIESCEFENLLYKCGNIPRDIGLSATRRQSMWSDADNRMRGSINFEEFLQFNLKYFAPGTNKRR